MNNILGKVLGVICGLFIYWIVSQGVYYITLFVASPLANSARAVSDIEATGSILGLIVGVYLGIKVFGKITKRKTEKTK